MGFFEKGRLQFRTLEDVVYLSDSMAAGLGHPKADITVTGHGCIDCLLATRGERPVYFPTQYELDAHRHEAHGRPHPLR